MNTDVLLCAQLLIFQWSVIKWFLPVLFRCYAILGKIPLWELIIGWYKITPAYWSTTGFNIMYPISLSLYMYICVGRPCSGPQDMLFPSSTTYWSYSESYYTSYYTIHTYCLFEAWHSLCWSYTNCLEINVKHTSPLTSFIEIHF